jgi:alkyl sulfatase BDS1-like metallo-beta-lactamase superfamily hydrolase
MNQGYYPDQIIELVDLPVSIKKSPFLNEFYGTVRWSVKSIYNGYLGWFNGNPAELDPLSRMDEAQNFADLAGGEEALFLALQKAVNQNEMQWALELSDRLMALKFSMSEVESLRRKALLYIGARSSNPNKRNYILSSALELSDSFVSFPEAEKTSQGVKEISIDTIFSILSVRLNPEKVINKNLNVCFYFLSGLRKTISIRNQVAAISDDIADSCNISVKATEFDFKMAISGLTNPIMALATGDIEVDVSNSEFLNFLTYFR